MEEINYGIIIKNLRVRSGMTQTELGKKIHVGKATISAYERGKIMPPTFIFFNICDVCNAQITITFLRQNYSLKELTREY